MAYIHPYLENVTCPINNSGWKDRTLGSSISNSDLEEGKSIEQNGAENVVKTVSRKVIMGQGFSG